MENHRAYRPPPLSLKTIHHLQYNTGIVYIKLQAINCNAA